jgi:hypothetical protein
MQPFFLVFAESTCSPLYFFSNSPEQPALSAGVHALFLVCLLEDDPECQQCDEDLFLPVGSASVSV